MNAIFFDRQKNFFRKKLIKRIVIFTVPVMALTVLFLINPVFESFESAKDTYIRFFGFSPAFFAIIYIASMGRIVTASVFTNCDVEMLNYPYFRTKESILSSFKTRFITAVKYNLVVTSVFAGSVLVVLTALFRGMDFLYASLFFILLTILGILFSFNDLFLYYVLQPYDSDGKSNNVMYTFINIIVFFIAYLSYQFSLDLFIYAGIVAAVTAIYLAAGRYLLKTAAPKNYKLS